MVKKNKIAVVFGGSGFVGTQVVRELAKAGYTIKVASRVPERAYFLRPCGNVGQVVPVACDYGEGNIADILRGADVVVNCVGILYERGKGQFQKAHVDLPAKIAAACAKEHVGSFVHISALGCDRSTSKYAKSKLEGETEILNAYPEAVILRPSVIFGEDDEFFNMFARLSQIFPALPLIGGGETKFQPVFVGDVADAVMAVIANDKARGHIYELGGPETVTFKEIYQRLFKHMGIKRTLVNLPFCLAKMNAFFLQMLPGKPMLTPDQVESLKTPNIVQEDVHILSELGIKPTAMDLILPEYLQTYKKGGRFAGIKAA